MQVMAIRRTTAQGTLDKTEIQEAQGLGLVFNPEPIESEPRTRGGKYQKILDMVRRLPVTTVEMGRSPHYTMFLKSAQEVRTVYAALTSTRARQKRTMKKSGGGTLAHVAFERRIDPEYYDQATGKKGRFTITLWNEG